MNRFLENAREIFEAAETSAAAGYSVSDYTILLGSPRGGIRMIADSGWSLGQLQHEHGAQLAYRVHAVGGRLMVDGRGEQSTCRIETATMSRAAAFLLNAVPAWDGEVARPVLALDSAA